MKWSQNSKKILAGLAVGLFVTVGTYNAVVINSETHFIGEDVKFVKRLDEVYGVFVSKREVAASLNWQKVSVKQAAVYRQFKNNLSDKQLQEMAPDESPAEVASQAAVQEELNLTLSSVMNPKKWQQGLAQSQFSGSLNTSHGVIESLSVSLPNGEGLSVSFSEMSGNVFEYDMNGELYSGMMYQDGTNSYVVTLTNGPLEGTRLCFSNGEAQEAAPEVNPEVNVAQESEQPQAEIQEQVAEMPVNESMPAEQLEQQDMVAQETAQSQEMPSPDQVQTFNFDAPQAAM